MTLGEIIKEYRLTHNISQRQFAIVCQLSNGYISMLEDNVNPKTGEPIAPSLATLNKVASGMGMTLNSLLEMADDMPVTIPSREEAPVTVVIDRRAKDFVELFGMLTVDQQNLVVSQIKGILSNQ